MCRVTLCGSFHRYLQAFSDRILEFESSGCEVLSPRNVRVVDEIGEFLFVASDPYRSIKLVESRHLFAIGSSDFVWLVAPNGYVGLSTALEIGLAVAKGKTVYTVIPPNDLTIREYVVVVESPQQAIKHYYLEKRKKSREGGILLDPVMFTDYAHSIVDQIGLLLGSSELDAVTELEEKVSRLVQELLSLYNPNLLTKGSSSET